MLAFIHHYRTVAKARVGNQKVEVGLGIGWGGWGGLGAMEQGRDRDPGQSIALLEKRGLGWPLNGHRIPAPQSWMG